VLLAVAARKIVVNMQSVRLPICGRFLLNRPGVDAGDMLLSHGRDGLPGDLEPSYVNFMARQFHSSLI
jgi:hypothetical protein